MKDLPILLAIRVPPDPFVPEGTTEPLRLYCSPINNLADENLFLVKAASNNHRGSTGIASEIIVHGLAIHFEIATPEIASIEVPKALWKNVSQSNPPASDHLLNSLNKMQKSTSFGSSWIQIELESPLLIDPVREKRLDQITKIFALDALIYNCDRTTITPNLLSHDNKYWVIDHEKAFSFLNGKDLSDDQRCKFHRPNSEECFLLDHIFYPQLKRYKDLDPSEFVMKLANLSDKIIDEIFQQIPYEHRKDQDLEKIKRHLSYFRENAEEFQKNILRILAWKKK